MTTQIEAFCRSCGVTQATAKATCDNTGRRDSRHTWQTREPQSDTTQPVPYYEAIQELRDRLAWHQDTLRTLRRSIEEHAARAVELEDECFPVEQTIASIRALIGLAGGAA